MILEIGREEAEDLFRVLYWDLVIKTQTEKARDFSKKEQQELKTERKVATELLKDIKGISRGHRLTDKDYQLIGLQKEKI